MSRYTYGLLMSAAVVTGAASAAETQTESQMLGSVSTLALAESDQVAVPAPESPSASPRMYATYTPGEGWNVLEIDAPSVSAADEDTTEKMKASRALPKGTRTLDVAGRTGADALTAAQVRYTGPDSRPINEYAGVSQPSPLDHQAGVSTAPAATDMAAVAPAAPIIPEDIPQVIVGQAAPEVVRSMQGTDAEPKQYARTLDTTGRSGADALTAAQVRYKPSASGMAVAEAAPHADTMSPPPAEVAPILADLERQAAEEEAVREEMAALEAARPQRKETFFLKREVVEPKPVVETAMAPKVRTLDSTGRTGADALTAAQIRYTPAEDTQAPVNPVGPVNPVRTARMKTLDSTGRTGADALTARQARYVPSTEEKSSMPQRKARVRYLDPAGRVGADALTAAQVRYVPSTGETVAATATEKSAKRLSSAKMTALDAANAVSAINAYRAKFGMKPLRYNSKLSQIAESHVNDLARRGEVSALTPRGEGIGKRLIKSGYRPNVAGSLVSGGYDSFEAALAEWQTTDMQRSKLLIESADQVGVAFVADRNSPYVYYIETIIAS